MKYRLSKSLRFLRQVSPFFWGMLALFIIIIASIIFLFVRENKNSNLLSEDIRTLATHITELESKLASTTDTLESNIKETKTTLSNTLTQNKQDLQNQLGSFQNKVGEISGTVSTLEKLSKTDPELLQKYSKVFFLNEHYAPPRLSEITDEYKYFERRNYQIHDKVWPKLKEMLDSAKQDGLDIFVFSAYRSFDEQSALKGAYTVVYGAGTANQFSADQGYSEHQLGTTVDLITTGIGGTLDGFEKTSSYKWLTNNAYKYGFVLSYPKNNTYYTFEPWHWRFVGITLATHLHNIGKNFYDLDQRDIDEYLVSIFD